MKTKSFYVPAFGKFAPPAVFTDSHGFALIHDSPRYAEAPNGLLKYWTQSRLEPVRNAALMEQAERRLADWRNPPRL